MGLLIKHRCFDKVRRPQKIHLQEYAFVIKQGSVSVKGDEVFHRPTRGFLMFSLEMCWKD